MLAKVPSVLPETLMHSVNLTATLDTSINLEDFNQIHLFDEIGPLTRPIIRAPEDPAVLTVVSIQLNGNLTFSDHPIDWAQALGTLPNSTVDADRKVLTIEFAQPHALAPWAFRFVVDNPDVKGFRSPIIYVAKPMPNPESNPEELHLIYKAESGDFLFKDSNSRQEGLDMGGDELILFNIEPTRKISVNLVTSNTSIVFSQSPVRFQTDTSGINVTRKSDTEVEITITAGSLPNEVTGLKFALDISKNGSTTTLLSPDPILINATIGDG